MNKIVIIIIVLLNVVCATNYIFNCTGCLNCNNINFRNCNNWPNNILKRVSVSNAFKCIFNDLSDDELEYEDTSCRNTINNGIRVITDEDLSCERNNNNNNNEWDCIFRDTDNDDEESLQLWNCNVELGYISDNTPYCCVYLNGTCRSDTTIIENAIISSVVLLLVLAVLIGIILVALFLIYKIRRKQSLITELASNRGNNDNLELMDANTVYSQIENNNIQEPTYSAIGENSKPIEPKVYENELYDTSPQYGLIINELYAGFVEGDVADVKIYEELSQLKFQISPTHSIINNPLYNAIIRNNPGSARNNYIEPPSSLPELQSNLKCCPFEIKISELEIREQFASGNFGVVYRAIYHTGRGDIPVAVKTLRESAKSDTKVSFMTEAATLAQFSHPNVLRLIGVITLEEPWMIVTELLKTELRELLIKLKAVPQNAILPSLLFKFSHEIAAGMEYLAGINFIHRDLAARNVLVAKDMTIRIADFGMSREVLSESNYYTSSSNTIPLRWTAPEAVLYKKFSEKSDVWSYGMTLFEIWTLGDKPWGEATNEEIIEALTVKQSPALPPDCPEGICRVLIETWRGDKNNRPTFSEVRVLLSGVSIPVVTPD